MQLSFWQIRLHANCQVNRAKFTESIIGQIQNSILEKYSFQSRKYTKIHLQLAGVLETYCQVDRAEFTESNQSSHRPPPLYVWVCSLQHSFYQLFFILSFLEENPQRTFSVFLRNLDCISKVGLRW